jgi:ankyrin repeat protein
VGSVLPKPADRASAADSALKPATLQSAVTQGDLTQTATLLDQGAVIDARDESGRTPLMLAVTEDRVEIVRLLLARGADPNAADNSGHTPLQQATKRNLQDVAALLQQAGAH